nr:CcmD family protein [candidate division Zixibacteria bacterium]
MDVNFIVMLVVLIIWLGIFLYMFSLDKKLRKLEKKNES